MTEKRFYMDKSGDLYDRENGNGSVMIDFGYSYDGVGCKRIIDLLNELAEENKELKEENQELLSLIQEDVESWSDEKKQALCDMSNAILGDFE